MGYYLKIKKSIWQIIKEMNEIYDEDHLKGRAKDL